MTASIREIKESPVEVGLDERPIFSLTTTPWGSSPTSPSVKAFQVDEGAYTDVTTTVFPTGSAAAVGDVITLPALAPQAVGDTYRVEVKFTVSGSVLEAYAMITVTR